jgi:hypothetical protein
MAATLFILGRAGCGTALGKRADSPKTTRTLVGGPPSLGWGDRPMNRAVARVQYFGRWWRSVRSFEIPSALRRLSWCARGQRMTRWCLTRARQNSLARAFPAERQWLHAPAPPPLRFMVQSRRQRGIQFSLSSTVGANLILVSNPIVMSGFGRVGYEPRNPQLHGHVDEGPGADDFGEPGTQ